MQSLNGFWMPKKYIYKIVYLRDHFEKLTVRIIAR